MVNKSRLKLIQTNILNMNDNIWLPEALIQNYEAKLKLLAPLLNKEENKRIKDEYFKLDRMNEILHKLELKYIENKEEIHVFSWKKVIEYGLYSKSDISLFPRLEGLIKSGHKYIKSKKIKTSEE